MEVVVAETDPWVATTLRRWNLEKLIADFGKNHITKTVFFKLNEKTIDRLIPSVGLNIEFKEKFDQLLKAGDSATEESSKSKEVDDVTENQALNEDGKSGTCVGDGNANEYMENINGKDHQPKVDVGNGVVASSRSIHDITNLPIPSAVDVQLPDVDEPCDTVDTPRIDDPPPKQTSSLSDLQYEEFLKILRSNIWGHLFLANFKRTKRIDKRYLCKALMPTLLVKNENYRLTKKDWDLILANLKRLAPEEKPSTFYSSKSSSDESTGGCCYNFCRPVWEDLKKEGLIPESDSVARKKAKTNCNTQVSSIGEAQDDKDMKKLRNEVGDLKEMKPIWMRTYKPRSLLDHNLEVEVQIKQFKCTQQSYAHILFASDFDMTYPTFAKVFMRDWPTVAALIVKIVEDDTRNNVATEFYKKNKYLIEEGKTSLLGLLLLALVEDTRTVKNKWRPTKTEVKDGFILHVETSAQLTLKQEAQMKYYNSHGCKSIQPYVVIVGDLKEIDSCFIQVNSYQYTVDDPVEAVDFCYKIFFALNADYPPDSKHVWMFLQKYVYKMNLNEKDVAPVDNLCRALDIKKQELQDANAR